MRTRDVFAFSAAVTVFSGIPLVVASIPPMLVPMWFLWFWVVPILSGLIAIDTLVDFDNRSNQIYYPWGFKVLSKRGRIERRRQREWEELNNQIYIVTNEMFRHPEGSDLRQAFSSQLEQLQIVKDRWNEEKNNRRITKISSDTNRIIDRELGWDKIKEIEGRG